MELLDPPNTWTGNLKRLGARFAPRAKIIGGLSRGLLSAAAAILAYLPTKPLGLQEGFWASITYAKPIAGEVISVWLPDVEGRYCTALLRIQH
jgi:hypothetical protein